eukprot:TRINITY_DN4687_c0_g1_i2.p2 TRINITY_DN4687_c0_g1~~TRINITY_DN4687_c0_g1_i2.p2  ORF type:complete len:258 (-),score=33.95 TRINITY_DN4687_c0_g1_i2:253-1026(-)
MSSAKSLVDAEHLFFEEECNVGKNRCLCCCCTEPAVVKIYSCDQNGGNKKLIGNFKESSDCLQRALCNPCHPFNGSLAIDDKELAKIQVPCKCNCGAGNPCSSFPFCCSYPCMKPEANISITSSEADQSNQLVGRCGKLMKPYYFPCLAGRNKCPDFSLNILGKDNNRLFMIDSSCCQKSVFCGGCRGCGCQDIEYKISDGSHKNVGKIKNLYTGCYQELCSRSDNFLLTFPDNSSLERKVLLTMAVVFLNYESFDD